MSVMVMTRVSTVASVASEVTPISGVDSGTSGSRSTPAGALPPRVAGMVAVGVSQSVPHLIRGCCSLAGSLSGCRGWKCH
jgi:hypothetical protein